MSPKNISTTLLLKKFRSRGLFFSNIGGSETTFRLKASQLPSDWDLIDSIVGRMERSDPAGKKSNEVIKNCVPEQDIEAAVRELEAVRGRKYHEIYKTTKASGDDKTTIIEVGFTEIDLSVALPYQRRQRKVKIEVTEGADGLCINYTSGAAADKIIEGLKSFIQYTTPNEPDIQRISVNSLRTAELRTRFFMLLIRGIEGFQFDNSTQILVDRRFPEDDESEEADEEENALEPGRRKAETFAEKKLKGLVNRVSLHGEQVESADLYEHARNSGYYIAGMKWTAFGQRDSQVHVDFEAGFDDPVEGKSFIFSVVRQWQFSDEDPDIDETVEMSEGLRRRFEQLLYTSAVKALNEILESQKQASPGEE